MSLLSFACLTHTHDNLLVFRPGFLFHLVVLPALHINKQHELELIMADFTPPVKVARHVGFTKFLVRFSSAILSFLFVVVLSMGSTMYHIRDVLSGRERENTPKDDNAIGEYVPRKPYPDMKALKITKDLRYYALQLGLDLEEYSITTSDGYVLVLHRLIDPKDTIAVRQAKRPILLQHGLLLCSGAWLAPGTNSLPYYFWEQGYDVWMGNNRCGFEPKHTYYEGNLMHNEEFWDWDIRAFASYDLPCIIDNVLLHKPDFQKVILVAHLQGCTQTFLMLRNSEQAAYHRKIEYFFALAPAVFPGLLFHTRSFIKFIHHRSPATYNAIFGSGAFVAFLGWARRILGRTRVYSTISYQMFKYLFGWSIKNCYNDNKVLHLQFLFNVTYVSARLMSWWLSYSIEEGFLNQLQPRKAYETGDNFAFTPVSTKEENVEEKETAQGLNNASVEVETAMEVANVKTEPVHDDSKTFFPYKDEWFAFNKPEEVVPMITFICNQDFLVDGKRLATHMRHYESRLYKEGENLDVVELDEYNHLDVIWSKDAIGRIGMVIDKKVSSLAK